MEFISSDFRDWLVRSLRCPESGNNLKHTPDGLTRPDRFSYPIIKGIPIIAVRRSYAQDFSSRRDGFHFLLSPPGNIFESVICYSLTGTHPKTEWFQLVSRLGLKPNCKVLEVTPGPYHFGNIMRNILGAEINHVVVSLCNGSLDNLRKILKHKSAVIRANASALPFADNTFDTLFHFGGMHRFREPDVIVNEFLRVVRPGGVVSFGGLGLNEEKKNSLRGRIALFLNPGFSWSKPRIPDKFKEIYEFSVFNGFGYQVVGIKS